MFKKIIVADLQVDGLAEISLSNFPKAKPSELVFTIKLTENSLAPQNTFSVVFHCTTKTGKCVSKMIICKVNMIDERRVLFYPSNFDDCEECRNIEVCTRITIENDQHNIFFLSLYNFNDDHQKEAFNLDIKNQTPSSDFIYCETQDFF